MDMTSLSSTLPGNNNASSSRRQNPSKQLSPEPTDDGQTLIEAFQSAARSVTHLYRSSAVLIRNSRQDGYTDALSDVLEAIDNESAYNDPSLALSRIRNWVIDRRHEIKGGAPSGTANRRAGSMPPQQQREMSAESEMDDGNTKEEEQVKKEDSSKGEVNYPDLQQPHQNSHSLPSVPSFSFQPLIPVPQYPTQTTDPTEPLPSPESNGVFTFNAPASTNPLVRQSASNKVPLAPRSGNSGLGAGAGTKRRNNYVDFFDISGFGNFGMNGGRDLGSNGGPGSGKRGRFV
ncbi:hypothetical protein ABW20_dc0108729 [Dactylellina cionopaga]|nr:hypothetical protein ABW20_dc0108729 [Dactylellina cionopaga]